MNIEDKSAAERKSATYTIYLKLHATRHAFPAKTLRTVISELMYAEPFAWRAVGITRAALDAYHQAAKNRLQGIERAHLTDRFKMIQHILDRDEPLSQDDLFSYWRETDQVVIALRSENRSNSLGEWVARWTTRDAIISRLGIASVFKAPGT